jgi:hypothetical protein
MPGTLAPSAEKRGAGRIEYHHDLRRAHVAFGFAAQQYVDARLPGHLRRRGVELHQGIDNRGKEICLSEFVARLLECTRMIRTPAMMRTAYEIAASGIRAIEKYMPCRLCKRQPAVGICRTLNRIHAVV